MKLISVLIPNDLQILYKIRGLIFQLIKDYTFSIDHTHDRIMRISSQYKEEAQHEEKVFQGLIDEKAKLEIAFNEVLLTIKNLKDEH
jgi:hypothetical protein